MEIATQVDSLCAEFHLFSGLKRLPETNKRAAPGAVHRLRAPGLVRGDSFPRGRKDTEGDAS